MPDFNTQIKTIASRYGVESVLDALIELYAETGRELEDTDGFKQVALQNAEILRIAQSKLKTCW